MEMFIASAAAKPGRRQKTDEVNECDCQRTAANASGETSNRKANDGGKLFRFELPTVLVLETGKCRRDFRGHRSPAAAGQSARHLHAHSVLPETVPFLLFQSLYG